MLEADCTIVRKDEIARINERLEQAARDALALRQAKEILDSLIGLPSDTKWEVIRNHVLIARHHVQQLEERTPRGL